MTEKKFIYALPKEVAEFQSDLENGNHGALMRYMTDYAFKLDLYHEDEDHTPMPREQLREYAEVFRKNLSNLVKIYPDIAVAYAPHIMHALQQFNTYELAQHEFRNLATQNPFLVLTRAKQFDFFANKPEILQTAERARIAREASGEPLTPMEAVLKRQLDAVDQVEKAHGVRPYDGRG